MARGSRRSPPRRRRRSWSSAQHVRPAAHPLPHHGVHADVGAGRPPLSERLEFRLGYRGTGRSATTSSRSPARTRSRTCGARTRSGCTSATRRRCSSSVGPRRPQVDANRWTYPDKVFTVRVQQPSEPKAPVAMTVLTKTGNLVDGFRVRPTLQHGENPWEMPLFYTDERSVFFVTGDEQLYHEGKLRTTTTTSSSTAACSTFRRPVRGTGEAEDPEARRPRHRPAWAARNPRQHGVRVRRDHVRRRRRRRSSSCRTCEEGVRTRRTSTRRSPTRDEVTATSSG